MYNINKSDIEDAIQNCTSAMTVKGQIIGYAYAYRGKNIENRYRPIKDGWYALHIGASKKENPKHQVIFYLLDYYFDESKFPPTSSIIGCFKIEGHTKTRVNNKWYFGPVGNFITKFIRFKEPIKNIPGHQSITYNLKTIDKKLSKKNYQGDNIKTRIQKELEKLL